MKKKLVRWSLFLAIAGGIYFAISYLIKCDDAKREAVADLCSQAFGQLQEGKFAEAEELYAAAFERTQVDTIASRLIQCKQAAGDINGALEWLNLYEEVDRKSDFTTLRRAQIYIQNGSLDQAKTLLHTIIDSPVQLSKVGFLRPIIDQWLNSDQDHTSAVNHYQYYVDYVAKLTALQWLLYYAEDMDEVFELGERLSLLAEDCEDDYAIMDQYFEYTHIKGGAFITSKYSLIGSAYHAANKINQHVTNTLGVPPFCSVNILTYISDTKWSIANNLLTSKHLVDGFDAAVEYINQITANNTRNTDTFQMYNKFIYGIYLAASGSEAFDKYLTREEMDAILLNSVDANGKIPYLYLTIGEDGILGKEDREAIQGDEVSLPIIVLGCNDWTCYDQMQTFGQYNLQHRGERKTIRYIDTNFDARSSYTDRDMFGLQIHAFPSNLMCLNLLQAVYDKQMLGQ